MYLLRLTCDDGINRAQHTESNQNQQQCESYPWHPQVSLGHAINVIQYIHYCCFFMLNKNATSSNPISTAAAMAFVISLTPIFKHTLIQVKICQETQRYERTVSELFDGKLRCESTHSLNFMCLRFIHIFRTIAVVVVLFSF